MVLRSVILLVIIIYMFGVLLTDGVTEFLNNEEGGKKIGLELVQFKAGSGFSR